MMKNQLVQSNNPFLAAYADNKVHWYFWDTRVLQLAREQQKPIFIALIKPYCRRCDELMDDYFDDNHIAETLNHNCVSILLDGEERPSFKRLISIWREIFFDDPALVPPTMVLFTPKFEPWKTYQPPAGVEQRDAFLSSLNDQIQIIINQPELTAPYQALLQSKQNSREVLKQPTALTTEKLIDSAEQLLESAEKTQLLNSPARCSIAECLLRLTYALYHTPVLSVRCLSAAVDAAYAIISHDSRDHIEGGYFSVSHDQAIEQKTYSKNLGENAQVLSLLLHLYAITRQADFYDEINHQLKFLTETMISGQEIGADGQYIHSLHEDLTTEAGSYYQYSPAQVRQYLPAEYYVIFSQMYGLLPMPEESSSSHAHQPLAAPNNDAQPRMLYEHCRVDDLARLHGISLQRCRVILQRCRDVLVIKTRTQRKPLLRDHRIMTHSNALMVSALVEAGWLLSDRIYYHYADTLLNSLIKHLWLNDTVYVGRTAAEQVGDYVEHSSVERYLLASGNLDDYALLLKAVLDCLTNELQCERLILAEKLADLILERFYDAGRRELCYQDRQRYPDFPSLQDVADSACPAAVPVALESFRRLGWMTGRQKYLEIASHCSVNQMSLTLSDPVRHASMLKNLTQELNPLMVLWFIYDENDKALNYADRVPVYAGRTQYYRVSSSALRQLYDHYRYDLYHKLMALVPTPLRIVVTRMDEVLETVDNKDDLFELESQIKRANRVRL